MLYKAIWATRALLYKLLLKKIGWLCYVGKPTFILRYKSITIGNKVRIFPGVRMECHNKGSIIIEDDVSIGQHFHVISSNEVLTIGRHTTLSGNVFITNIDHNYEELGKHILQQPYIVKTTQIGENCFIGYGAAIQAGTILGKQCIVGANSVVRGIFPDYCVIVGAPAKIVKRYNADMGFWQKTDSQGNFI